MNNPDTWSSNEIKLGIGGDGPWVRWSDYDQLRQRLADEERLARHHSGMAEAYGVENDEIRAKLALADKWARAWRNRFIDERMNAYPEACYEMKRCYAESDANDFEAAIDAAIGASGEGHAD